jgi:hypothetical protein
VPQLLRDDLQDTIQVFHHVAIPESNYPIPMICDVRASGVIRLAHHRALPAIDFDGQPGSRTSEIHNVSANGVLSAEPKRHPHLTPTLSAPRGGEEELERFREFQSRQVPALAMMVENSLVASAADMPGVLQ